MRLYLWLVLLSLSPFLAAGLGQPRQPAPAARETVSFSGRVLDIRGRPAPGATVYVSVSVMPDALLEPPSRLAPCQTRAAADGAFRLTVPVPEKAWTATVVAVREGQGPGGQLVRSAAEATGLAIRLTHPSFLAGKVVDRSGQPVAGAKVSVTQMYRLGGGALYLPPEEVRPPVLTDAQGRFRLASLTANSRLAVNVEHPDYAPLGSMRMPFASGRDDLTISLAPGGTVVGRVVYEDGRPAAHLPVHCQSWDRTARSESTDAAGRFRFTRVREDHYLFRAELPDYVSDPQGVVPAAGQESRCPDLRLVRGGILTGKVTDEKGRPIAGVSIYSRRSFYFSLTNTRIEAQGPDTRTGADGVYRLRLPPGKWRVSPGYFGTEYTSEVPWDEWPSHEIAEGQTLHQDFKLQKARAVRGRVLDAAGRPAAGAKLQRGNWVMVQADAAGRFTLDPQIPPGQATEIAFFRQDGLQGALRPLTPTKLPVELVVRLQRLPVLTGLVTDRAGHPIDGAWINAEQMVPTGGGMSGNRPEAVGAATADARGRFVLRLFPGTRYRISVQEDGFVTADQFPVIPGGPGLGTGPLRFRLERADSTIAGVVVDPEGKPIPAAEVNAGRTGATNVYVASEEGVSDANGRFRLAHLPSGTVSVFARRTGYDPGYHPRVAVGKANIRLMLAPREETVPPLASLKVGAPAPEIRVAQWVNGTGPATLAALRGKTVLLQFSAAYNRAATASNAALTALQAKLKAAAQDDMTILALYDSSASAEEVAAYARTEGLSFPIGLVEANHDDRQANAAFRAYGVRQLPALFLIDREGLIQAVNPDRDAVLRLAR